MQKLPEKRAVVLCLEVTQLMHDDVVYAFLGRLDKRKVQRDPACG